VNEDERGITPLEATAMTLERLPGSCVRIVVERGNGDSIQDIDLSYQEWLSLLGMLESYHARLQPAIHVEFMELGERPASMSTATCEDRGSKA
jgi:hypothetical protein